MLIACGVMIIFEMICLLFGDNRSLIWLEDICSLCGYFIDVIFTDTPDRTSMFFDLGSSTKRSINDFNVYKGDWS